MGPRHWTACAVASIAAAAGMLAACTEATPPAEELELALETTLVSEPAIAVDLDELATIRCHVQVRASATGAGTATWLGGTFHAFVGTDRSEPADTAILSSQQIADVFESPTLHGGEARDAAWQVSAFVPFSVRITLRFRNSAGDPIDSVQTTGACGPEPGPASAPPVITAFALSRTDNLHPGDTLMVDYSLASTDGLWQSAVVFSAACDTGRLFADTLRPTLSRAVEMVIPPSCQTGVALDVTVQLQDALTQLAESTITTELLEPAGGPRTIAGGAVKPALSRAQYASASRSSVRRDSTFLISIAGVASRLTRSMARSSAPRR